ncbi:MAG TPA: zf-TFIIB domain-containing protein [Dehalococcoidia bacterium]|nr:zf-TFIIB domain-containing protein [Dehalococcoidia bacterium]
MICPACKHAMVIVEHENIELDYCTSCRGVWFDSGELEMLLEAAGMENYGVFLERIIDSEEASSPEKKRRCPICNKKMKKSYIDEDNKLLVDICKKEHGIWFDGGEVAHLIKLVSGRSEKAGSREEVMGFLGDVFKY